MKTRIVTGAVLMFILTFGLVMGGWVFSALFLIFTLMSVYEVFKALKAAGRNIVTWPIWLCALLIFPLFFIFGSVTVLLPLVIFNFALVTGAVMFQKEPHLEDVFFSAMPLFCVILPAMCMLGLQNAPKREYEVMLILMAFGVPLAGDAMAYFIGKTYGRCHYCPAISPNKTLEGAVAGLAGSILFAILMYFVSMNFVPVPPLWHFLLLGLLGGVMGQEGDLFASFIKRYCGIKDFGSIFPGHGGFMDRLDSTYWATVVMYLYLNLYYLRK